MVDAPIVLGLVAVALLLAAIVVLKGGAKEEPAPTAAPAAAAAPAAPPAPNGRLQVFFGSQTGTAEGFAKTIADEARRRGFAPTVVDLEDFEADEFEDADWRAPTMVFAMATYGEGEPTDNSHVFFKWAKAAAKDGGGLLAGAKFAVFGLGNTQYQHFNAMGKLTDELLAALGGERCADLGLGDDDVDLEADFDAWRERLWSALCGSGGAADDGGAVALDFDVVFGGAKTAAPLGASTKFYADRAEAAVLATRELRSAADGGSTLHVELDAADLPYETADNLAILPANAPADVAAVAGALGLDLDASFALAPRDAAAKAPFPTPCGVREALTSYCDLTAAPKRANLAALVAAAGGDAPGVAKDNWAAWAEAVPGPPTLAAALVALGPSIPADAPREAVLAALVLKACPRLQPRYYTISSSTVADPGRVHVTCAVATLPPDGAKAGVCSATLAGAAVGATIRAFVRPSSFRAPPPGTPAPVVLIGPGTGVAPMRAILRERAAALAAGDETAAWGPARVSRATLYFGCKRPDLDHLYSEEMEAWRAGGALDALHVAYSRAQKHKVYVQDLLRRDADAAALAADVLDGKGHVYVCGGTAMGAAVAEALADVLAPKLGSRSDAKAYVDDMQKTGRYVQELWA